MQKLNLKQTHTRILDFYKDTIGMDLSLELNVGDCSFGVGFNSGVYFNEFKEIIDPFYLKILSNKKEYILIECPKEFIALCLHTMLDPLNLHNIDDDLLKSTLEITFCDVLKIFEKNLGQYIEIHPYKPKGFNDYMKTQLVLTQTDTKIEYPVTINGSINNIDDFIKKIFSRSFPSKGVNPTISASVVSAIRQINISKIKSLKAGEIILIMTDRHLINEPLVIIGQKLVIKTNFIGDKLSIISSPIRVSEIQELDMNQGDAPNTDAQEPTNTDITEEKIDNTAAAMADMKIPVSFELAKIDLPVNYLSEIKQGEVIDLQKPIDENVSVIVNGKIIALGEVVQVGHNFGVIIKEVI